jgi:hypothetical protein
MFGGDWGPRLGAAIFFVTISRSEKTRAVSFSIHRITQKMDAL